MVHLIKDFVDFDEQVKNAGDKIVVAKFFATCCGACKMIAPVFEKLADKYSANIVALEIDVDECDDLASKLKIELQPTFVFLKNGEKVEQWSGTKETKLEEIIKQLIN